MVTTRVIRVDELTHKEICDWGRMLRENPALGSPFFRHEFTLAVSQVVANARVIVAEQNGIAVAFLPFQIGGKGQRLAIGSSLNDFQGVISTPGNHDGDSTALMHPEMDGLFCSKLLDWQQAFDDFVVAENPSPFVDLSNGYTAWKNNLQKSGTCQLKQLARKERKLMRECGAVRFEYHTTAADVLHSLIGWKRDQYRRTNECDVFEAGWPAELLGHLLTLPPESDLQPVLSAMYSGDSLVAAHFGLACPGVCHWWFPGYNRRFAKYSPGKLMLQRLLQEAGNRGIARFDFGVGDEPYKYSFAANSVNIRRVFIDSNPARRWLRSRLYQTRMAVKESPVGPRVRELRGHIRSAIDRLLP